MTVTKILDKIIILDKQLASLSADGRRAEAQEVRNEIRIWQDAHRKLVFESKKMVNDLISL